MTSGFSTGYSLTSVSHMGKRRGEGRGGGGGFQLLRAQPCWFDLYQRRRKSWFDVIRPVHMPGTFVTSQTALMAMFSRVSNVDY